MVRNTGELMKMIKHIINFIAVGGFVPTIATFYLLSDGLHQTGVEVAYVAILALAIRLND